MKAYCLTIKDFDDAGCEIVFAENAKEAKKLIGELSYSLEQYTDLRVNRDKRFDGMEKLTPAELAKEQWRMGWWFHEDGCPDADEATDAQFCEWYERTFNHA